MSALKQPIVVQIVPQRAAAPEGVGDYARLIAEQLLDAHGIRSVFVAGTPLAPADRAQDDWETHELNKRGKAALRDLLAAVTADAQAVVLHLSAYGYHHKGIPLWLAAGMEQWRRDHPATPLITVFHELFATGPVWGSAFWLGPIQAHIARRMQAISTAGIATTRPYADLLDRWRRPGRGAPVEAIPVFSTIGDLDQAPMASERPASMVIFGRAGIFKPVYRDALPQLEAFVAANGITAIVDIGQRSEAPPAMIGTAMVRSIGEAPVALLRDELAHARFGLIAYDADRLAKSTVFAAYCAHGAVPVCISDSAGVQDGLRPGGNYLKLGRDAIVTGTAPDIEQLQHNAQSWYRPHSLGNTVNRIVELVAPPSAIGNRV